MAKVHLKIEVEFEDCDARVIESVGGTVRAIRRAMTDSLEELEGADAMLHVTRHMTESGTSIKVEEGQSDARQDAEHQGEKLQGEKSENHYLRRESDFLRQLLLDADEVARRCGSKHGLCDSLDNKGRPYPSESCASLVRVLKKQGRKPMLYLKDLQG